MDIDHLFLRAQSGAPEAALLQQLGLTEGSANQHAGQGTANRRFFFENAFIELLWIADASEVQSAVSAPTQLARRLNLADQQASPFGICLRPSVGERTAPFPSWPYQPAYLPAGMQVEIASDAGLSEPMWFFLAQAVAPAQVAAAQRQPLQHALGVRRLSALRITVASTEAWSTAAQAASACTGITLQRGSAPLLELTFDRGRQGRSFDLRPALPLILHC